MTQSFRCGLGVDLGGGFRERGAIRALFSITQITFMAYY